MYSSPIEEATTRGAAVGGKNHATETGTIKGQSLDQGFDFVVINLSKTSKNGGSTGWEERKPRSGKGGQEGKGAIPDHTPVLTIRCTGRK